MSEVAADEIDEIGKSWERQIADQFSAMPPWLLRVDRCVIKGSEWILIVIGALFTLMIAIDVTSRYLFGFSSFFISAAARFLLLWFFLLGAGLALRQGSHVGFDLLLGMLAPRSRRFVKTTAQLLALVFFIQMIWGGLVSLGPATAQMDPALHVSILWGFLAIPVGFFLLAYHLLILVALDHRKPTGRDIRT